MQIRQMRVAILTISTAAARGERVDGSGDTIEAWVAGRADALAGREVVPDDSVQIVSALTTWADADRADLILTTGGTGLSPTDVTPEATRAVLDREAPGIAERIRALAIQSQPRAALARGLAGVRHKTLIVNLPGSTSGVRDGLAAIDPIVAHAVAIIRGMTTDHSQATAS
jgi:molybdenum cofactor synthesis domain-containing protein